MTLTGRTSRRVMLASVIALGSVVLGIVPWRLVAAESTGDKQSPQRYLATITISEKQKGQPKTVLSAPKLAIRCRSESHFDHRRQSKPRASDDWPVTGE